jgi:hypothetical protein
MKQDNREAAQHTDADEDVAKKSHTTRQRISRSASSTKNVRFLAIVVPPSGHLPEHSPDQASVLRWHALEVLA